MPEKIIIADPVDLTKPTGKTINRAGSLLSGAAAAVAGIAANEYLHMPSETGDSANLITENLPSDTGLISATDSNNLNETADQQLSGETADTGTLTGWDPSNAPVAGKETVNDDMSFEEAFAAAREEVGAGGVFVWHGEAYNTFYAEETASGEFQANESGNNVESLYSDPNDDAASIESGDYIETAEYVEPSEEEFQNPSYGPAIIAADLNADGDADAIAVDLNFDGSADMLSTDLNSDGTLTDDEVIIIHDPESLVIPETPSDGSVISVDLNADGMDDVLLGDVNNDQVADFVGADENRDQEIDQSEIQVLNPEAMEGLTAEPETIEYSGEVASDVPEDVTAEVLDQMEGDLSNLEDNFEEINDWS